MKKEEAQPSNRPFNSVSHALLTLSWVAFLVYYTAILLPGGP